MRKIIVASLLVALLLPAQSVYAQTPEPTTCAQPEEVTPTYLLPNVRPEPVVNTPSPTPVSAPAPVLPPEPVPAPVLTPEPISACTPEAVVELIPVPLEERVPGSCKYLEELYCSYGIELSAEAYFGIGIELERDLLSWLMKGFGKSKVLAFNLPAGTPVYSPLKGRGMEFDLLLISAEGFFNAIELERKKGKRKGKYIFFFTEASFKAHLPKTAPVKAGQLLGTLTDETIGFPLNPTDEEYNLIVLVP